MNDRNPKKYTLWWNAGDGQASVFGGDYDSEDAARAAIPEVEQEFRNECNSDSPYDEDATWSVQDPELDGSIMTSDGLAVYVNLSDSASSIRYAGANMVELDDPYSPGWSDSPFQASQVASLKEAFDLIDNWDP